MKTSFFLYALIFCILAENDGQINFPGRKEILRKKVVTMRNGSERIDLRTDKILGNILQKKKQKKSSQGRHSWFF